MCNLSLSFKNLLKQLIFFPFLNNYFTTSLTSLHYIMDYIKNDHRNSTLNEINIKMQLACNNSQSCIESELTNEKEFIRIYVYQPFVRIRYIRLKENSCISVLSSIYSPDSIYIYDGQILNSDKTFREYNIGEGNKMVLLPSSMMVSNYSFVEKWLKLTSNKESFEEKIDLNMVKGSQKELARIKDIKFNKLDEKKKFLGKYFNTHKKTYKKERNQPELKCDYEPPQNPSCHPLPILW